jgi:hypothetical protein
MKTGNFQWTILDILLKTSLSVLWRVKGTLAASRSVGLAKIWAGGRRGNLIWILIERLNKCLGMP